MWWSSGKDKQTELGDNGLVVLIEFEMSFREGIVIRQIFSNFLRVFRWEFWQFCFKISQAQTKTQISVYYIIERLKSNKQLNLSTNRKRNF